MCTIFIIIFPNIVSLGLKSMIWIAPKLVIHKIKVLGPGLGMWSKQYSSNVVAFALNLSWLHFY